MGNGIVTRDLTRGDIPFLRTLLEHTEAFHTMEVDVAVELMEEYLDEGLKSGYRFLVAEDGAARAGYACYGPTPMTQGTWDIYWIAVEPTVQRRGVGQALMDGCEGHIRREGGRLIVLETSSRPPYEQARNFYAKNKYALLVTVRDFYAPGDHKLEYAKYLNPEVS
jgi:D-alanine-D-alanine ligase